MIYGNVLAKVPKRKSTQQQSCGGQEVIMHTQLHTR